MARTASGSRPLLSREFVAALGGLGLTLFSWYSSWEWPAWPALKTMSTFFGNSFGDLSFNARAAVLVGLIILNAGTWAVVFWLLIFGGSWIVRKVSSFLLPAGEGGRVERPDEGPGTKVK